MRYRKDAANLYKASGDTVGRRLAQARINNLAEKYSHISEKAGLREQPERAAVAGFRAVKTADQLKKTIDGGKINLQLFGIKSSDFATIRLPKDEYAMVMHELNTHMSADERKMGVVTKAIGDFVYTFENKGFGEYRIFRKKPIDSEGWDEE